MIQAALAPIYSQLANALRDGDSVVLQAAGGKFMCAEDGGPEEDQQPFRLTSRSTIAAWERWRLRRE